MPHVIGLDIGGANLKAAHSDGPCRSVSFPVWREPNRLAAALNELIADWLPCQGFAVTMTAELADCFDTKAAGVEAVLNAVTELADGLPVAVWHTVGEFVDVDVACEFPLLTAAANWHALASFAGRLAPRDSALLIDIGTTTTDIIPLVDGLPNPAGRTDGDRLLSGELVYTGVRRTPLCAIAHSVPHRNGYSQLAAELFATSLDVYLLTGDIPAAAVDCDTANGRPATIAHAHDRIARMLCCDRTEVSLDEARLIAKFLASVQQQRITGALDRVLATLPEPPAAVIISGSGTFLANRIVTSHPRLSTSAHHRLADVFSPETAASACAFALTRLAAEHNALTPVSTTAG
ncbi:MAG: hydantoinase/oxoprolinase family protein [Planctomycetota bacterium]|jgi:probable H4MPT-linked C1 transfer pathway protein